MDKPGKSRDFIGPCRFCGLPGSYLITDIQNGHAVSFFLCRDHASEKGPHSDGILPFISCPQCDRKMSIGWSGMGMEAHCLYCGFMQPYHPPGIR
jgi:hypothetical protein